MSDVILRFAEPLLQGADSSVEKNMIRFAIGVWNASLLPPPAQAEALKSIVALLPEGDQDVRRELVAAMRTLLARKQTYFADNTRVIVDYQITQSRDRWQLDVGSNTAARLPSRHVNLSCPEQASKRLSSHGKLSRCCMITLYGSLIGDARTRGGNHAERNFPLLPVRLWTPVAFL